MTIAAGPGSPIAANSRSPPVARKSLVNSSSGVSAASGLPARSSVTTGLPASQRACAVTPAIDRWGPPVSPSASIAAS